MERTASFVFEDPHALARAMRAVAHAARIEALVAFRAGDLSPVELSRRLDDDRWTLGSIAYHVRTLAAAGLIELAETIPRRGALEHRYALTHSGEAVASVLAGLTSCDRRAREQ